jgi:hypothetical protein
VLRAVAVEVHRLAGSGEGDQNNRDEAQAHDGFPGSLRRMQRWDCVNKDLFTAMKRA